MSDPTHDLENFGTGGIDVTPLPPSEVRRLGDRRRAQRRNAAVIAASVLAAVAVSVPVALTRGDDGSTGTPLQTPTQSPSQSPAPSDPPEGSDGVITYPGLGVEVTGAADAEKLVGTSAEFRAFIVARAERAV